MKRPGFVDSLSTKRARLDEASLISIVKSKLKANLDLRMKHSGQPLKFLQSEEDLFMAIRALDELAGSQFDEAESSQVVLDLLDHENPDIGVATIDLIGLLEISRRNFRSL